MGLTSRSLAVPRLARKPAASHVSVSPVSWGVSEMRGWGPQLEANRVLSEIATLGESAIEAGPPGFLPDRSVAARSLLKHHRLHVVAGPVRAVLHNYEIRGAELAHVDGHAAWLASLGAHTLTLTVIPSRSDGSSGVELSSTGWAHLLSSIGSVQHVCAAHRLRLAVEPRFDSIIRGPADIERLLVGSEAGVCLDAAQLVMAGADPIEVIELSAGRIQHVHINDIDQSLADQVGEQRLDYATAVGRGLFKPLGEGDAEVGRVIEALRQADYRGWYGLETEVRLGSVDDDPLAGVKRSLDLLRSLLP